MSQATLTIGRPPGVEADGAGRHPRAYSTFTGIFRKGGRLIYAAEASATSANSVSSTEPSIPAAC